MAEQKIGQLPSLPIAPSLERINKFDEEGVAFADALKQFGTVFNTRADELNTAFEQANATHEAINTLKDETQAIKEAAVVEIGEIKHLTENALEEAKIARDEAVGAVASLPDGVVNNNTISETDTWSSRKIADTMQTMLSLLDEQESNNFFKGGF